MSQFKTVDINDTNTNDDDKDDNQGNITNPYLPGHSLPSNNSTDSRNSNNNTNDTEGNTNDTEGITVYNTNYTLDINVEAISKYFNDHDLYVDSHSGSDYSTLTDDEIQKAIDKNNAQDKIINKNSGRIDQFLTGICNRITIVDWIDKIREGVSIGVSPATSGSSVATEGATEAVEQSSKLILAKSIGKVLYEKMIEPQINDVILYKIMLGDVASEMGFTSDTSDGKNCKKWIEKSTKFTQKVCKARQEADNPSTKEKSALGTALANPFVQAFGWVKSGLGLLTLVSNWWCDDVCETTNEGLIDEQNYRKANNIHVVI
jgi:hypothetical protein